MVTGNEDGAHAAAETTLFNLSHLGCTIPPNADTYWVGDAQDVLEVVRDELDEVAAGEVVGRRHVSW